MYGHGFADDVEEDDADQNLQRLTSPSLHTSMCWRRMVGSTDRSSYNSMNFSKKSRSTIKTTNFLQNRISKAGCIRQRILAVEKFNTVLLVVSMHAYCDKIEIASGGNVLRRVVQCLEKNHRKSLQL